MKRAEPHKVGTAFFQLYVAAHNVYDIGACQKLLNERLRYGHDAILTCQGAAGAAVKKPARGGLFNTQCSNLFCWCLFYEWDANPDAKIRASAEVLVAQLAARAMVVEISHRDRV